MINDEIYWILFSSILLQASKNHMTHKKMNEKVEATEKTKTCVEGEHESRTSRVAAGPAADAAEDERHAFTNELNGCPRR